MNVRIQLMIWSTNQSIYQYLVWLFHRRYGIDKWVEKATELYLKITTKVKKLLYSGKPTVNYLYGTYKNKDFLYDVLFNYVCSSDLLKENKAKNPHLKDISEHIYEGFGYDLIRNKSNS